MHPPILLLISADPLTKLLLEQALDQRNATIQYVGKRVIDVVLATVTLVVTSPLFVIAAIAIKLTSEGPIFYVQTRVGRNRREFPIYKFRTMVKDADRRMAELEHRNEAVGHCFKIANDPRITPVGKVLRRTSIDELPQLFNVLKGD